MMDEKSFSGDMLHAGNIGLGWRLCDGHIQLCSTNGDKLGGKMVGDEGLVRKLCSGH